MTPKARWSSFRIAAPITAMFVSPVSDNLWQKSLMIGLCFLATTAGMNRASRRVALPVLDKRVFLWMEEPEMCCLGFNPA